MDIEREKELMKHRCCFTGHRHEKLTASKEVVVSKLRIAVDEAIRNGYTTFITGMAPGVDVWAAALVFEAKKMHPNIKLMAAVPYPKFGKSRDYLRNLEYKRIIEKADYVKFISNSYYKGVFQKRNIWMVDHASLIIAICHKDDGIIIEGGAKNTVDYAEQLGREVKFIEI